MNWQKQRPNDPLLTVSRLTSETVFHQKLKQINLGRPYEIIPNLKEDQSNFKTHAL